MTHLRSLRDLRRLKTVLGRSTFAGIAGSSAFVLLTLFSLTAGASEAELILPDLASVSFLGHTGRSLLMGGLVVCLLGLIFGLIIYRMVKKIPVHSSMKDISELIYETCKTYLLTQGKFL